MSKLQIGDKLLPFKLKNVDGRLIQAADFKDAKILIVAFTCNHCPYVVAYQDRMIALQKEFFDQGVRWVTINSNDAVGYPQDSYENMILRAKEKNFPFPYLHDETQEVAKAYGAERTPEIFMFDSAQKLIYQGRIDDNWQNPKAVQVQDLHDAIQSTLKGQTIAYPVTAAVGCSIKWKSKNN